MSTLQHDIPGARVLDLFAGSGALGLETLSRGAAHVTFVEKASAPLRVLQSNIDRLRAHDEVTVVKGDALRYVAALAPNAFDIVLADPPYDSDAARTLIEAFARAPYAHILCIEHRGSDRLPAVDGIQTRRYGDTALTFITAPA